MIEIEEGIPMPERPMREVWAKMKDMSVGSSVLIPNRYRKQIFQRAKSFGFKVTTMLMDDLNTRVWRVK